MKNTALVINASVQTAENSVSRRLVADLVERLDFDTVIERDLSRNEAELITASHVGAYYTDRQERSEEQHAILAQSDALLAELKQANVLVIGAPMYNFSVPASLKAWIDLVCRVGETFRYTETGPQALLTIDTAYLVVATGGTPVGSDADFLVPYLEHVARFLGAKKVEVIAADRVNMDPEEAVLKAQARIAAA